MTDTVRSAVEKRREDPASVAIAKQYEHNFAEILPPHIEAKGFVGAAVAALRKNPDLLAAANNSTTAFVNTLMECASLGHVPGSKEFYLTARRSKDHQNKPIVVGLEGYRGVIERMYRSGAVASVIVREVCKGDRFAFTEGIDEMPQHEADWFSDLDRSAPENILGCYAYARLTNGATSRVVILSAKDIERAKQSSDAGRKNVGPWSTDYRAMVWKTAAHRLEPWVPTSAEYRREQLRAEAAAASVKTEHGLVDIRTGEVEDVVDAQVVEDQS